MSYYLFKDIETYLQKKERCEITEKTLLEQVQNELKIFYIAYIDRPTLVRNGFEADDLSDDDMVELAGMIGDLYCGSEKFDLDLETACQDFGLNPINHPENTD